MDWKFTCIIAIIIVVIIVLVYLIATDSKYVQKSYWVSNYIETPWQVYARSDGSMDEAAQLALSRAEGKANPTPGDHLLSATIITRNILGQERRLTNDPQVDADNSRTRRNLFNTARDHHMEALRGLNVANIVIPQRDDIPPQMIIDAATEFAFGGIIELLLMNDPMGEWEIFPIRDQQLATTAATRRDELVNDRRQAAANVVETQGGAIGSGVQTYMDLAIQNTNDPQNAHDTGVSACLKAIVIRLREDQGNSELPTLDTIRKEITEQSEVLSEGRAHRTKDVLEVINRVSRGERVMQIGATDGECLSRIWLRTKDPKNEEVAGQMVQAIYDALYDCWENGLTGRNIVCVNGRTSRILSSLILLDWDKRNWEVKKLEQFRNDIYAKTHELIKLEAKKATESSDADMRRAGALYLAESADDVKTLGVIPPKALEELSEIMKKSTLLMIDTYIQDLESASGIKGAIPDYLLDATKQEALAAI